VCSSDLNEKETIYRKMFSPFIKPVSGLPEFLELASSKGISIALATSAPSENVKFTLDATGLQKYFNLITDSSMISRGKPDPEIYRITSEKLSVKPSDCIVFEDAVPGIIAAKTAGMRVIGVATTHKSEELSVYVNEIIMNFEAPHELMEKLLLLSSLK
jgi:beta-phosphoglucomutase